jgi:NH3-dependent NAD+ synthetase
MSFLQTLSLQDLRRLRKIVMNVHMKLYPSEHWHEKEADKLIEALGPEVAENLIKKGVDTHVVE